jgi:hypothetical protein
MPHALLPREGSAAILERYRIVVDYVVKFLDAALKGEASNWDFLDAAPTRHGYEGVTLASPSASRN